MLLCSVCGEKSGLKNHSSRAIGGTCSECGQEHVLCWDYAATYNIENVRYSLDSIIEKLEYDLGYADQIIGQLTEDSNHLNGGQFWYGVKDGIYQSLPMLKRLREQL